MVRIANKSFGLIEALIAGGILTLVASGAVVLNAQVVRNTALLADRLVAFEWAQEGLEIVRQIRDSNLIDGNPETDWQCFNPDGVNIPGCGIILNQPYHTELTTNARRWKLVSGAQTNPFEPRNLYTREIRILSTNPTNPGTLTGADPEKRLVRVTVSFQFGGRTEQVTLATIISNWKRET